MDGTGKETPSQTPVNPGQKEDHQETPPITERIIPENASNLIRPPKQGDPLVDKKGSSWG